MAKSFKATNMKILMVVFLLFTISGLVAVYVLSANSNTNSSSTSTTPTHTYQQVEKLKQYIEDNKNATSTIDTLIPIATNAQNAITSSIDKAANTNSVVINGKSFDNPNSTATLRPIGSLNTGYVTLSFSNPVKYDNFIKFLEAIENSTPKMQIMNINISPASGTGQVTVAPITIGYYQR